MTTISHAAPGSWWLITCTIAEDDCSVSYTDVLARRLPDEISDPGSILFELLPLGGERVLVDVDQIHAATPVTIVAAQPAVASRPRLQLVSARTEPDAQECAHRRVHHMNVDEFLARYRDGDGHGWEAEFAWLRTHHADRLAQLRTACRDGIPDPVEVGPDGRVWDGHHRLTIAKDLGLQVPFVLVGGHP